MGFKHKMIRLIWSCVWFLCARPFPRDLFSGWKRLLLRLFGAKIHNTARVYSSANIYYPANLIMEAHSCIGPECDIYNVEKIILKSHVVVSQKSYLCTASHDFTNKKFPLITAPIIIEKDAWVAADSFIGMGVTIGEGAVVGARASVFKDVQSWVVVGGNPAKYIKERKIVD